jgi:hypothetical protein
MGDGFNFQQLKASRATDWEVAKSEWRLVEISEVDEPETCLCGHYPKRLFRSPGAQVSVRSALYYPCAPPIADGQSPDVDGRAESSIQGGLPGRGIYRAAPCSR